MRRRAIRIVGTVVGGGVILVLLAILFGRSAPPYDFLEGKAGHREPFFGPETTEYSFAAGSSAMIRSAIKELTSKGFEHDRHFEDDFTRFVHPADRRRILIFRDRIFRSGTSITRKGWVTVHVIEPELKLFDQVRDWLGL